MSPPPSAIRPTIQNIALNLEASSAVRPNIEYTSLERDVPSAVQAGIEDFAPGAEA